MEKQLFENLTEPEQDQVLKGLRSLAFSKEEIKNALITGVAVVQNGKVMEFDKYWSLTDRSTLKLFRALITTI